MEQADVARRGAAAGGVFERLLDFLNKLDQAYIFYLLGHTRPDSVMIDISVARLALGGRVHGRWICRRRAL